MPAGANPCHACARPEQLAGVLWPSSLRLVSHSTPRPLPAQAAFQEAEIIKRQEALLAEEELLEAVEEARQVARAEVTLSGLSWPALAAWALCRQDGHGRAAAASQCRGFATAG